MVVQIEVYKTTAGIGVTVTYEKFSVPFFICNFFFIFLCKYVGCLKGLLKH